jgi:hypothetical protein
MSESRIFDEAMEPYGGRLDRVAIGPSVTRLFDYQRERAQSFLSSVRSALPALPPIHFDFVNSFTLNARVGRFKGEYCIGINSGVVLLFGFLFGHFLSNREVLPDIGDPNEEASNPPLLPFLVFDAAKMIEAGILPVSPVNNVRFGYSQFLLEMAFDFLVSHEVCHIVNGHVDYLSKREGVVSLAEVEPQCIDPSVPITRQTMEMDADTAGACDGIGTILRKTGNINLVSPPWRQFYVNPSTASFAWCFAVHSLFRLFGDERFLGADLGKALYPPVRLRQFWAACTAEEYVTQKSGRPQLQDIFRREYAKALVEVEKAFSLATGEEIAVSGFQEALSKEAGGHLAQLLAHWKNILRPALLPLAYGRLPD